MPLPATVDLLKELGVNEQRTLLGLDHKLLLLDHTDLEVNVHRTLLEVHRTDLAESSAHPSCLSRGSSNLPNFTFSPPPDYSLSISRLFFSSANDYEAFLLRDSAGVLTPRTELASLPLRQFLSPRGKDLCVQRYAGGLPVSRVAASFFWRADARALCYLTQ